MDLPIILITIAYLNTCSSGYDYTCPIALNWLIRGKILCNTTTKYSCLRDENTETFREICRETPRLLAPGNKYVIRGSLDGKKCNEYRYQPFIFKTNQNSECAIKKSNCNEKGQVITRNGSVTEDKTCRCDYSNGYAPIKPRNPCHCIPSVEDCSCHLKRCPAKTHLSFEFICESDYTLVKLDYCGPIKKAGSDESNLITAIKQNMDKEKLMAEINSARLLVVQSTVLAGVLLSIGAILVLLSGGFEDFDCQKGSRLTISFGSTKDPLKEADEEQLPPKVLEMVERKKKYLDKTETRIIIIGKKGIGKTTTRDNIIQFGHHLFQEEENGHNVEYTQTKDGVFLVVDIDVNSVDVEKEIRNCVGKTSPGPHAILFVMNATDGYKEEDYEAFKFFLSYFGPDIRCYGIAVFTNHTHSEKNQTNVNEYIKNAPDELLKLVRFFENRKVLINNLDEEQRKNQVKPLIQMIRKLKRNGYYTNAYFQQCEHTLLNKEVKLLKKYLNNEKTLEKYENEKIRKYYRMNQPDVLQKLILPKKHTVGTTYLPTPKGYSKNEYVEINPEQQRRGSMPLVCITGHDD